MPELEVIFIFDIYLQNSYHGHIFNCSLSEGHRREVGLWRVGAEWRKEIFVRFFANCHSPLASSKRVGGLVEAVLHGPQTLQCLALTQQPWALDPGVQPMGDPAGQDNGVEGQGQPAGPFAMGSSNKGSTKWILVGFWHSVASATFPHFSFWGHSEVLRS